MTDVRRFDARPTGRWRFDETRAALVMLPIRLFLAAGWIRAGVEKVIEPAWWSGDALREFLAAQHDSAIAFFRPFMDGVITTWAIEVAALVAISEILIGLAIGFGRPLRAALWWGVVLNVSFVLAGRVNPSAFYLIMEIVLLHAIATGVLVRSEPRSTRWTLAVSVAWFLTALHFIPYVHTLEPAKVIEDPAMMMIFLSVILGFSGVLRWMSIDDNVDQESNVTMDRLTPWILCHATDHVESLDDDWDAHQTDLYLDGVLVETFEDRETVVLAD